MRRPPLTSENMMRSLRHQAPVVEARHMAAVAGVMKELEMTREEAERFMEIEAMYEGIDERTQRAREARR